MAIANDLIKDTKQVMRFLKLLSEITPVGLHYHRTAKSFSVFCNERKHNFDLAVVNCVTARGWVIFAENQVRLSHKGLVTFKNVLELEGTGTENAHVNNSSCTRQQTAAMPIVNYDESPLMRLYMRRNKSGTSYLSDEEFRAGEVLRRDFELGGLQPNVTSSFDREFGGGKRNGIDNVGALSDTALDAKNRLNNAMDALGPELSGVTIDICCFLKGLEQVEQERNWPRRSAKLMLKTALSLLKRHYGFLHTSSHSPQSTYAWGTDNYRPTIQSVPSVD